MIDDHLYRYRPRPVRIRYRVCSPNRIMIYKIPSCWLIVWRYGWRSSPITTVECESFEAARHIAAYLVDHVKEP